MLGDAWGPVITPSCLQGSEFPDQLEMWGQAKSSAFLSTQSRCWRSCSDSPEKTRTAVGQLAQMDNIFFSVCCLWYTCDWLSGLGLLMFKSPVLKTKICNNGVLKSGEMLGGRQQSVSGRYWEALLCLGLSPSSLVHQLCVLKKIT